MRRNKWGYWKTKENTNMNKTRVIFRRSREMRNQGRKLISLGQVPMEKHPLEKHPLIVGLAVLSKNKLF